MKKLLIFLSLLFVCNVIALEIGDNKVNGVVIEQDKVIGGVINQNITNNYYNVTQSANYTNICWVNQSNIFVNNQTINGNLTADMIYIPMKNKNGTMWYFGTDRAWAFESWGNGAQAQFYITHPALSNKHLYIGQNYSDIVVDIQAQGTLGTAPVMALSPISQVSGNKALFIDNNYNQTGISIDSEALNYPGIYIDMISSEKYAIETDGVINTTSNISAKYFMGDGSKLTGVSGTADFTNVSYINRSENYTGLKGFKTNPYTYYGNIKTSSIGGRLGWGGLESWGYSGNPNGARFIELVAYDTDSILDYPNYAGGWNINYDTEYYHSFDVCDGGISCTTQLRIDNNGLSTPKSVEALETVYTNTLELNNLGGTDYIYYWDKDALTKRTLLSVLDDGALTNSLDFGIKGAGGGSLRYFAGEHKLFTSSNNLIINFTYGKIVSTQPIYAPSFVGNGSCLGEEILYNSTLCMHNGTTEFSCYTNVPAGYRIDTLATGFHNGTTTFSYISLYLNNSLVDESAGERAAATNPTPFSMQFSQIMGYNTIYNATIVTKNKTYGAYNGLLNKVKIKLEVYKIC